MSVSAAAWIVLAIPAAWGGSPPALPFETWCSANWLVPGTTAFDARAGELVEHRRREQSLLMNRPDRPWMGELPPSRDPVALEHACFLWKDLRARTLIARYVVRQDQAIDTYYLGLYERIASVDLCPTECQRTADELELNALLPGGWCYGLCEDVMPLLDPVCGSVAEVLQPASITACVPPSKP